MATHSALSTPLLTVMKDVAVALDFDRHDRNEDAYRKYLECVLRVSTNLLKALHTNEGHVCMNADTAKMVKLGQQCMDRVANIVQNKFAMRRKSGPSPNLNLPLGAGPGPPRSDRDSLTTRTTPHSGKTTPLTSPQITSPDVMYRPHDHSTGSSEETGTKANRKSSSDSETFVKTPTSISSTRKLTPMAIASKQNQQLLSAFRKRQTLAKNRSASETLSLTLQRKMAENLAIARAQEEALAKKMKERQARLEEQAAKRFHTPMGLSEEEQHQRQIYRKVLEFEQEQVWMSELRQNLERSPTDIDVISELIMSILSCTDHPLTGELFHHQNKIMDKISGLVNKKQAQVENITVPLPTELYSSLKLLKNTLPQFTNTTETKSEKSRSKVVIENMSEKGDTEKLDNSTENSEFSKEINENDTGKDESEIEHNTTQSSNEEVGDKDVETDTITSIEKPEGESKHVDQTFIETDCTGVSEDIGNDTKACSDITDDEETEPVHNNTENIPDNKNCDTSARKDASATKNANLAKERDTEAVESGPEEPNPECDITQVTIEIKGDVEKALVKGEDEMRRLEKENEAMKSLSRRSAQDYELYNQENMDDLFDSSDEDMTGENIGKDLNEVDEQMNEKANESNEMDKELKDITIESEENEKVSNDFNDCKNEKQTGDSKSDVDNDSETSKTEDKDRMHNIDEALDDSMSKDSEKADHDVTRIKRGMNFENIDSKIAKLKNEAYHRHLKGVTEDILGSIEKVQVLFVISFEQLDKPEGRDQCNVLLEDFFFRPLWKHLLLLFRLANEPKEISLAAVMTSNQRLGPKVYHVRDKLCLETAEQTEEGSSCYPYQSAVNELRGICQCTSMLEKLDYLVKASKQVMYCVEQHYTGKGEQTPSIGADDLLPVLCYVVTRSALPQLVSECHAVETFIHEGYMFGEEGYCLTSFQTAINYLISEGLRQIE